MEDRTVVVDTENDVQYKFFNEHGTWFVAGTILGTLLLADKKPQNAKPQTHKQHLSTKKMTNISHTLSGKM